MAPENGLGTSCAHEPNANYRDTVHAESRRSVVKGTAAGRGAHHVSVSVATTEKYMLTLHLIVNMTFVSINRWGIHRQTGPQM